MQRCRRNIQAANGAGRRGYSVAGLAARLGLAAPAAAAPAPDAWGIVGPPRHAHAPGARTTSTSFTFNPLASIGPAGTAGLGAAAGAGVGGQIMFRMCTQIGCAILAFWVGVATHVLFGLAVALEQGWTRDGPGHELDHAGERDASALPKFDPLIPCRRRQRRRPLRPRVGSESVTSIVLVLVLPASVIAIVLQTFIGWGCCQWCETRRLDGALLGLLALVQYADDPR
ncbi:unnamed protein product [Prorocentrum cordatum]|uniref:Uncharacterized protein n=1 Tax=Prorocentrum cordatum TaxID=2364126 RepID=A0ABN9VIC9_9DINO|nr:unnamed protein product [Polarella glacialis]